MKKSNTNLTITVTEGNRNIAFILDFLANAKQDFLFAAEIGQVEKLQQLLAASVDDQAFAAAFPQQDIDDFLDVHGRPLAYIHGDKTSHLRLHVIFHCARKAYDMLAGNYGRSKLEEVELERFAVCDSLYDAAIAIAKPTNSARSLKDCMEAKYGQKARVS